MELGATSSRSPTTDPCAPPLHGQGASTVAFHYHMYGAGVGELRLTNAAGGALWSLSGNQGNAWQAVSVETFSASFAFEYRCGSGYMGDAAVAQVAAAVAPPARR